MKDDATSYCILPPSPINQHSDCGPGEKNVVLTRQRTLVSFVSVVWMSAYSLTFPDFSESMLSLSIRDLSIVSTEMVQSQVWISDIWVSDYSDTFSSFLSTETKVLMPCELHVRQTSNYSGKLSTVMYHNWYKFRMQETILQGLLNWTQSIKMINMSLA